MTDTKATLDNLHAQTVAAILRHTVNNPSAPTLRIEYNAWARIKRVLFGRSIALHVSEVDQFVQDFCDLLVSIAEATSLSYTADDLTWLIERIEARDALALSLLVAMTTMQPQNDTISTQDAAEMLGHADNTVIRKWCAAGRFLSARRIDDRTWVLSRSELQHRADVQATRPE